MTRLCLLLVIGCAISAYADIHSCGGFVRSSIGLDYSKVQVKLLTPEGHLKHEEDLNPQNGYYMIPIYNKGKYSLKVSAPEGWYFEPEKIDIDLDGSTDPCSRNEDINFSLTAFSINGVVEAGSTGGPAGLQLSLNQGGKTIATTVTDSNGKYFFKAAPGSYEVAAAPSSSACISHGSSQVQVSKSPVTVVPNLKISGYHLSVSVKNQGKPLAGVSITALSNSDKLPGCQKNPANKGYKYVCNIGKTSSAGTLELPCAPIGSYELLPVFKTDITSFSFTPNSAGVEVVNDKKNVVFEVSGFSGKGRINILSKKFDGADIVLNGRTAARADKDGRYELTDLKEGNIELTARAAKTEFNTVKANLRLPEIKIPDIVPVSYEVCGSVEKLDVVENLALINKETGDSIVIRPSQDGTFCKYVAPAKYSISPADSSSSLTPRALDIDVTSGPIEGLRFTHYKTDAEARVTCIGNCGLISMSLLSGDTVIQTANGDDVTFSDIGPGDYIVRLVDDGLGCWAKKELPLHVERAKPQPIHFVQEGFVTSIQLSHSAKLKWSHVETKKIKGEVDAVSGVNKVCVPLQGKYQIALESCMEFSPSTFEVTVPSSAVTESSATTAKVSGIIVSEGHANFQVKVKSAHGERVVSTTNGIFSFNEPLSTEGDIILVPTSENHLFDPASFVFKFNGKCSERVVEFVAAKGIFIDGQITPPVPGVEISAVHRLDSNVVFNTVSDKSGRYRVGPVKRAEDLAISASLDGYSFNAVEGKVGVLRSVKLSQISVVIMDSATSEGLDGVLLSVVGGKEYRSNNMVKPSGKINFVGLAPGDYFLRPILQEYKFEPSTTTVTVKEGEHQQVQLKGKRVAYSVLGKVREMSGQALADVVLEALSEKCDQHQSEATTGSDGSFRIRGLKPGCEYSVGIKPGSNGPHCFPSQFDIQMTSDDVKGLEMVASPRNEQTELAVEVEFNSMLTLNSYKVEVSQGGHVVANSILTAPTSVYYLTGLPRDGSEYSVRIEADRPAQAFHAKTVFVNADAPVRVVRIPVSSSRKASEVEIGLSSVLALPFFALVILVVFNQNKALELSKTLYEKLSQSNSPTRERRRRK
ncbi:unnamed protein product [Auanema sp. JU1783]|nr:unnamed protein product [Auanema sp. JU1783]